MMHCMAANLHIAQPTAISVPCRTSRLPIRAQCCNSAHACLCLCPRPLHSSQALPPASLAALEGFSLSRAGCGRLRWLRAVDVRGLQLDALVAIGDGVCCVCRGGGGGGRAWVVAIGQINGPIWPPVHDQTFAASCCASALFLASGRAPSPPTPNPAGEVSVYPDTATKPPPGEGLNAPCKVCTRAAPAKHEGGRRTHVPSPCTPAVGTSVTQ